MTERRQLRALSLPLFGAAALAVTLAGCTRPTPLVTVQSHGEVVQSQADIYCRPSCTTVSNSYPNLRVVPNDLIGIDVAGAVAAAGWYVKLDGRLLGGRETSHYTTISAPLLAPGSKAVLTVFKLAPGNRNVGVWQFILIGR